MKTKRKKRKLIKLCWLTNSSGGGFLTGVIEPEGASDSFVMFFFCRFSTRVRPGENPHIKE